MSEEGNDDVGKIAPDAEGKIPADKEGKFPEVVPWSQYVGIKESLGKKVEAEKLKVTSLEEASKLAISAGDHQYVLSLLAAVAAEHQGTADELKGIKDKSVSEMRETLKGKGVPEAELATLSEKELGVLVTAIGGFKPKADLGGGGGSGELKGSPMELARLAYTK